jgi:hypothetical protein
VTDPVLANEVKGLLKSYVRIRKSSVAGAIQFGFESPLNPVEQSLVQKKKEPVELSLYEFVPLHAPQSE